MRRVLAIAVAGFVTLFSASSFGVTISSTFDSDADGWTTFASSIVHQPAGGNPDGYIRVWDDGNFGSLNNGIRAPGKFLGNLSAFDGALLSFDSRRVSGANGGPAGGFDVFGTVRIRGQVGATVYEAFSDLAAAPPASVAWETFSGRLTAADWGIFDNNEWALLLSNVTEIAISTEAFNGRDSVGIDNVVLTSTPLPAAIWLFLTALGGLGLVSRRSRLVRRSSA